MNRADLRAALDHPNVRAFLAVLRHGEGTSDPAGYRRMFGGAMFTSMADHPRLPQSATLGGKPIISTAAGAYQFLAKTWDGLVKQYAFPDFSESAQDEAAVALIAGRRALEDVRAGRLKDAILKCAKEWASLPGSPYGQPTIAMSKCISVYLAAGGKMAHGELPVVDQPVNVPAKPPSAPAAPVKPPGDTSMAPFIPAAITALIELVPALARTFGSGSEVSDRNVKAAEIVVTAAKQAIGAKNEQDLIETIKADPAAATAVREAVKAVWFDVAEVGGGIAAAREANIANSQLAPSKNMALWVTAALLPLIYMTVGSVLFLKGWSQDIKVMVVTAVVSGVLGAVLAYWLGTSFSSAKKDEKAMGAQ